MQLHQVATFGTHLSKGLDPVCYRGNSIHTFWFQQAHFEVASVFIKVQRHYSAMGLSGTTALTTHFRKAYRVHFTGDLYNTTARKVTGMSQVTLFVQICPGGLSDLKKLTTNPIPLSPQRKCMTAVETCPTWQDVQGSRNL